MPGTQEAPVDKTAAIAGQDGGVQKSVFCSQGPGLDLHLEESPDTQSQDHSNATTPLKKTQEQTPLSPAVGFSPSKCGCISTTCQHTLGAAATEPQARSLFDAIGAQPPQANQLDEADAQDSGCRGTPQVRVPTLQITSTAGNQVPTLQITSTAGNQDETQNDKEDTATKPDSQPHEMEQSAPLVNLQIPMTPESAEISDGDKKGETSPLPSPLANLQIDTQYSSSKTPPIYAGTAGSAPTASVNSLPHANATSEADAEEATPDVSMQGAEDEATLDSAIQDDDATQDGFVAQVEECRASTVQTSKGDTAGMASNNTLQPQPASFKTSDGSARKHSSTTASNGKPAYKPVATVTPTNPATTTISAASMPWIRKGTAKKVTGNNSVAKQRVPSMPEHEAQKHDTFGDGNSSHSEAHTDDDDDGSDPFGKKKPKPRSRIKNVPIIARPASTPTTDAPEDVVSRTQPNKGASISQKEAATSHGTGASSTNRDASRKDEAVQDQTDQDQTDHVNLTPAVNDMDGGALRKRLMPSPAVPVKETADTVESPLHTPAAHETGRRTLAPSSSKSSARKAPNAQFTRAEVRAPGCGWIKCIKEVTQTRYFRHKEVIRYTKQDGVETKVEQLSFDKIEDRSKRKKETLNRESGIKFGEIPWKHLRRRSYKDSTGKTQTEFVEISSMDTNKKGAGAEKKTRRKPSKPAPTDVEVCSPMDPEEEERAVPKHNSTSRGGATPARASATLGSSARSKQQAEPPHHRTGRKKSTSTTTSTQGFAPAVVRPALPAFPGMDDGGSRAAKSSKAEKQPAKHSAKQPPKQTTKQTAKPKGVAAQKRPGIGVAPVRRSDASPTKQTAPSPKPNPKTRKRKDASTPSPRKGKRTTNSVAQKSTLPPGSWKRSRVDPSKTHQKTPGTPGTPLSNNKRQRKTPNTPVAWDPSALEVNSKVLAQYSKQDPLYYRGTVRKKKIISGKTLEYKIHFDDDSTGKVDVSNICTPNLPAGSHVHVLKDDHYYKAKIISDGPGDQYTVKFDDQKGHTVVPKSDVAIDRKYVAALQGAKVSKAPNCECGSYHTAGVKETLGELPPKNTPLNMQTMQNYFVFCTGIESSQKEHAKDQIQRLGGVFLGTEDNVIKAVMMRMDHAKMRDSYSGVESCLSTPQSKQLAKAKRALQQQFVCVMPEKSTTPKYLLAAAAGIPCVTFEWVAEAVNNALRRPMKSPPKTSKDGLCLQRGNTRGGMFDGKSFRIIGNDTYEHKWKPILKAAGANLLDRTDARRVYTDQSSQLAGSVQDLTLMCEKENEGDIPATLRNLEIPIRGKDWVIECLQAGAVVTL